MANSQLGDTEKMPYTLVELDGASQPVAGLPTDAITVISDAPASAKVVPDDTPVAGSSASGWILGGVPKNGVTINATVTHADGSVLSASATVDIVGGMASSLAFGFGAPVAQ